MGNPDRLNEAVGSSALARTDLGQLSAIARPAPELYRRRRVWQELSLGWHAGGSFLIDSEAHVVFSQNVSHDRLDLLGRKVTPWARMTPVPKGHRRRVRRHVLETTVHLRILLSKLRKAESIEDLWFGVELRIHGDGVGWHPDCGMCRDREPC